MSAARAAGLLQQRVAKGQSSGGRPSPYREDLDPPINDSALRFSARSASGPPFSRFCPSGGLLDLEIASTSGAAVAAKQVVGFARIMGETQNSFTASFV